MTSLRERKSFRIGIMPFTHLDIADPVATLSLDHAGIHGLPLPLPQPNEDEVDAERPTPSLSCDIRVGSCRSRT
jgi:hypothetical protein